ncbi:hypothetical protein CYMTET_10346 [Cymbomonas tetramitiformis]|uniref:THO complex subunit 7 n=1 Tax=Cymbomonas tetramitiformis TaxID=36881 RepID=A0AAE0LEJ8_9CHLO|nr:hypothetical protein CYMTET_10346 [Cymbomonas tetramitiformis]|eukprot:gene4971-6058_t
MAAMADKIVVTKEEDEIIRKRLLTQTATARGVGALNKLAKGYIAYCKSEESSKEEAEALYQTLLKELAVYELQIARVFSIKSANHRQQASYATLSGSLDNSIAEVQVEIKELKASLEAAREERNHKEQYEELRHKCMEHPARSETLAAIKTLEQELQELEEATTSANKTLELRKKQFALVLHAVDELQKELDGEEMVVKSGEKGDNIDQAEPMEI